MNIRKQVMGSLMMAVLALGVGVTSAAAEEVYNGTFNLPTEAYWGGVLLEPGQYTFSIEQNVERAPIFHLRGEGVSRSFVNLAVLTDRTPDNHLELANINGTYVVSKLDAGLLGKTFSFAVPKAMRNSAVSSAAQTVTVAVSSGAAR